MTLLDQLGVYVRGRFPLWARFERWVWGLPAVPAALLTSLGHGVLTAVTGPLAPVTAIIYTVREINSERAPSLRRAPKYDAVLDIVVPWLVVAFYAYLLGGILA